MIKGDLVRQIEGALLGDSFFRPDRAEDSSLIGIVIDTKHETSWISGHGPIDEWYALVTWSTGSTRWISLDCLTNYGI